MENENINLDDALIISYLHKEMLPAEILAFENRLKNEPALKNLLVNYQQLDLGLRKIPKQQASDLLTERIMQNMATAKPKEKRNFIHYVRVVGWAALIMFAIAKFLIPHNTKPNLENADVAITNHPTVLLDKNITSKSKLEIAESGALEWLHQAQAENGSWVGEEWGANSQYTIGLTGLSLLAFANAEHHSNYESYLTSVEKATRFILSTQNTDGSFGPAINNRLYNHGIATVALFKVNENYPNLIPTEALQKAVTYISASQNNAGGWGYFSEKNAPNTAISIWQIHSLILAKQYGFAGLEDSISKNLAWLKKMSDQNGVMGYKKPSDFPFGQSALVAMSGIFWLYEDQLSEKSPESSIEFKIKFQEDLEKIAMAPEKHLNYYQFYFLTTSLKKLKEKNQFQLAQKVEDILITKQIKTGNQNGSWEPNDAWGPTGGRVYSTAMATISLVALK